MRLACIFIIIYIYILCPVVFAVEDAPSKSPACAGALQSQDKTDKLSAKSRVFVKRFRITGNTGFTEEELSVVTAPYENREITFEELQTLRQGLTQYFIERGYISSGVIVPDQQVVEGVITLKVIEGVLSEIEVEGNKRFRSFYIKDRMALASGPPVNINKIRQALQLLQQDTRIRRINAELSPDIMPGEGILKVRLEEESPFKAIFAFSNSQSPSVGAYRGEMTLAHQNLFGLGDILEGKFGLTEGNTDILLSYSVPVSARDTAVRAYYRKSESTVVEETFKRLDIESRSKTYGLTISHPLYKTPAGEFTLALSGEVRRNATYLLGRPFSFSDIDDNVTHVTALRLSQEWVTRSPTEVLALRSNFSAGIDMFGATVNKAGSDGRFLSWTGQVQWIRRLSEAGLQMVFRTDVQLANDPLLPMEKFSVGGMNSVRGYRENQLVRDNGVVSSFELRMPVFHNRQMEPIVWLAPFADIGWSWNTKNDTPAPRSLSSVGAGIRWIVTKRINCIAYAGYPFRKMKNPDHDLQEEGVHFQLNWQVF